MKPKPIQVYFSGEEARKLAVRAKARKTSMSEIVRGAVRRDLAEEPKNPLFELVGAVSGSGDDSVNFDRYLVGGELEKAKRAASKPVRGHGSMDRVLRSKRSKS